MKVFQLVLYVACGLALSLGCSPAPTTAPAAQTPGPASHDHGDHEHDHGDHDHDHSEANEIEAAMASLSVEDRAAATAQKVCPVSGEPLGSMGTPQKVDVKGQSVFICCEACTASLMSDPDKFLTKSAE